MNDEGFFCSFVAVAFYFQSATKGFIDIDHKGVRRGSWNGFKLIWVCLSPFWTWFRLKKPFYRGLVAVGIGTFLVSIYGFITASSEAKRYFISQGVLLIVCLLTLIYLIFIGFNLSATISRQVITGSQQIARERYFESDPKQVHLYICVKKCLSKACSMFMCQDGNKNWNLSSSSFEFNLELGIRYKWTNTLM